MEVFVNALSHNQTPNLPNEALREFFKEIRYATYHFVSTTILLWVSLYLAFLKR
jgi:hypothetical protein